MSSDSKVGGVSAGSCQQLASEAQGGRARTITCTSMPFMESVYRSYPSSIYPNSSASVLMYKPHTGNCCPVLVFEPSYVGLWPFKSGVSVSGCCPCLLVRSPADFQSQCYCGSSSQCTSPGLGVPYLGSDALLREDLHTCIFLLLVGHHHASYLILNCIFASPALKRLTQSAS